MALTTFVLRILDTTDGTFAVGALDLDSRISIEEALDTAMADMAPGQRIERITNADTGESLTLNSIARAPKGFGQ